MRGTHDCPKEGCPARLDWAVLACRPHWFSLPQELRNRINRTWRNSDTAAYLAARQEAVDFLNRP